METPRPHLVGLVCWVLIIVNMYGIYAEMKQLGSPGLAAYLAGFPYSSSVAEIIMFSNFAISIVCGICMYERLGWARYVYIAVMVPYFVQNYLASHNAKDSVLALHIVEVKFVFYLASIVILFLPAAYNYYYPPKYIDGRD